MAQSGLKDSTQITKLNSENYAIWKFKIQMLLMRDGLDDLLDTPPPENPNEAFLKRDRPRFFNIRLSHLVSSQSRKSSPATSRRVLGVHLLWDFHYKISDFILILALIFSMQLQFWVFWKNALYVYFGFLWKPFAEIYFLICCSLFFETMFFKSII